MIGGQNNQGVSEAGNLHRRDPFNPAAIGVQPLDGTRDRTDFGQRRSALVDDVFVAGAAKPSRNEDRSVAKNDGSGGSMRLLQGRPLLPIEPCVIGLEQRGLQKMRDPRLGGSRPDVSPAIWAAHSHRMPRQPPRLL